VNDVVRLYGIPISIMSNRDPRFTSKLWPNLQNALGTRLKLSMAYHPQIDGQSERTIQILEDLLRARILEFEGHLEDHLPLVEFTYNNSYQTTIGMTPYEALFGRKCRTLVCWHEIGERKLLGPELVHITTDKVKVIKKRMKEAQDRQKSYVNHRRWPLEFSRGDKVFLFEMKGKLAPWYIGLFKILERIGSVAYQLKLPPYLKKIHSIFHMSLLRKVEIDPSRFPIEIKEDLMLEVKPMKILDQSEKELRIRKFN